MADDSIAANLNRLRESNPSTRTTTKGGGRADKRPPSTYTEADLWTMVAKLKADNEKGGFGWDHAKQVQIATQVLKGQRTYDEALTSARDRVSRDQPLEPDSPLEPRQPETPREPDPPDPPEEPEQPEPRDFEREARALFPWIPNALLGVFVDAWVEMGDPNLAMAELRADPRYPTYFAGNRRDDGTVRLPEAEYLSNMEAYARDLAGYGVDPADFQEQFVGLIEGDVSPQEFRNDRLAPLYLEVVSNSDQIRAFYAQIVGATSLSDSALFASALDRSTPAHVFEQRLRTAQIGGTRNEFGFGTTTSEAERLESFGLDEQAARSLYAQAAQDLPTLSALSARFGDPNDPLTIDDYEEALVVRNPGELATLTRLVRQGNVEYGGLGVATDQTGAQRGLLSR